MNKRIISFVCAGLVATSCVSSLCFYDYFANDGTTSNLIYWIFDFFQLSILLGQAGIGVYTINVLLRQRKEAISSLGYFAAHVFLQNYNSLAPSMVCGCHYGISAMVADESGRF